MSSDPSSSGPDPLTPSQASPLSGGPDLNPVRRTDPNLPDRETSHSGLSYPVPPRLDKREEPIPAPRPKRWPALFVAVVLVAAAFAAALGTHHSTPPGTSTTYGIPSQHDRVLTVTGADLDQAATDRAVAELKRGSVPEYPMLAALPQTMKAQILDGERKFYRLPQSDPAGVSQQAGDRISVDFNGHPYGTYDLSKPVSIDMPLMIGDQVGIHCVSLAPGKSSVTVDVATVLNPVRTQPLAQGESVSLKVESGQAGQNYEWFEQEARSGNPVAEYGLGHMYQFGLGVPQDRADAIHWYEAAAAQNYLDAKAQLQLLQSNP